METVKVRRVGNSNVVSLPKDLEQLGFVPGAQVLIDPQKDGTVVIWTADTLRQLVRRLGMETAQKHREALDMLAESESAKHDASEDQSAT